jgi:hypothetical protein
VRQAREGLGGSVLSLQSEASRLASHWQTLESTLTVRVCDGIEQQYSLQPPATYSYDAALLGPRLSLRPEVRASTQAGFPANLANLASAFGDQPVTPHPSQAAPTLPARVTRRQRLRWCIQGRTLVLSGDAPSLLSALAGAIHDVLAPPREIATEELGADKHAVDHGPSSASGSGGVASYEWIDSLCRSTGSSASCQASAQAASSSVDQSARAAFEGNDRAIGNTTNHAAPSSNRCSELTASGSYSRATKSSLEEELMDVPSSVPSVSQLLENLSAGVAAQRQLSLTDSALPKHAPLESMAADQADLSRSVQQILPPGLQSSDFDLSSLWGNSNGAAGQQTMSLPVPPEALPPERDSKERLGRGKRQGGVHVRCVLSVARIVHSMEGPS